MKNNKENREYIYKNYFDAIYRSSNILTKKEYKTSADNFNLNFGKYLPLKKSAEILDIGCGAGHFLHFLKIKG